MTAVQVQTIPPHENGIENTDPTERVCPARRKDHVNQTALVPVEENDACKTERAVFSGPLTHGRIEVLCLI